MHTKTYMTTIYSLLDYCNCVSYAERMGLCIYMLVLEELRIKPAILTHNKDSNVNASLTDFFKRVFLRQRLIEIYNKVPI